MERQSIIGLVLIFLILIGYQLLVPTPETTPLVDSPQTTTASIDTTNSANVSSQADSLTNEAPKTGLAAASAIEEKDITIETSTLKLTFTTKGGLIKEAMLKGYKTFDQKPLYLITPDNNRLNLLMPTHSGEVNLSVLNFTTQDSSQVLGENDSTTITFRLAVSRDQFFEQVYTVYGSGYLIDYGIRSDNIGISNQSLILDWSNDLHQLENDMAENRKSAGIDYYTDELDEIGKNSTSGTDETKVSAPVNWFSFKHKYFLLGLIAKDTPFKDLDLQSTANTNDPVIAKTLSAKTAIPVPALNQGKGNFQFYLGPNDYQLLKKLNIEGFEENVYLGYAFLKPINKFILVPLFNVLESVTNNYGILIILLVLIVKLALTPLTYKSYMSMAKMKVLAPELEEIRKSNPDDMGKQQQEQMKLYQQVGVNPLSGCIPVLATMPILFSLFFLFPNLIELRQQPFLWSNDLSTYDSIIKLPIHIPFIGSHISLFTVLMTVSSIGYAYYNNQITPTQQNSPINMKFLSYVMPVMFMFVLNSFPAGLTFYYFVSNVVTIAQQLTIRKFVDEDKIREILNENRKKNIEKPNKGSKFQQYLEKSLQAAEEAKKKQAEAEKKNKKRSN